MTVVTVAAAQHRIVPASSWQDYAARMQLQVGAAAAQSAGLLVFAEYASLALVAALPEEERATLPLQLANLQRFVEAFCLLWQRLAHEHQVWIVAPSFPLRLPDGRYANRAWIAGPQGEWHWQDKIHMTRFERELFAISPGDDLTAVDTGTFCFAVAICYDSEFPTQVHKLCRAGAQIIAVPSCTDGDAGYHRVMLCSRARAIENQCFVVQSPLSGDAQWCDAIDTNTGFAGIFSPVDRGFPADGLLAMGSAESDGWVIADCDLAAMAAVRSDGQVFNWRDSCADAIPAQRP